MRSIFHLAFHVRDLDAARRFYADVLGCHEGRSTATWVDFDFFGHQISLHLGVVLALPEWQALAERLTAAKLDFVMAPQVRFEGQPGEQWTMFFRDPSGNPIEVKGFRSLDTVFNS